MKRGQVTYFIIAGLIILIAIIMVLATRLDILKNFYEEQRTKLVGAPAQIKPVESYIQECLDSVLEPSIDLILIQGGYYEPKNYVELDLFRVTYWFNGGDISPSLKIVENEITKGINPLFQNCINEFDSSYLLDLKEIKHNIQIKDKNILLTSTMNIGVIYKNITFTIEKKFNIKKDSEVFDIYNTGKSIVDSEVSNPEEIDLTFLTEIPYDVNFFKTREDEIIYIITSNETTLYFANKFK